MNHLLKEYSEDEARPCIEMLGKINEQYCASLDQLTERLQAQRGWDFGGVRITFVDTHYEKIPIYEQGK